jgi:hypothetical protein
MLTIEVSINILVFALIILSAGLAGFSLRGSQVAHLRFKINQLEREILDSHAEILTLEKENVNIETRLQDIKSPVIPIKTAIKEEQEENEKIPDISLRKKLLSKENLKKHIRGL